MATPFHHQLHATGFTRRSTPMVHIDGRSYPASSRDLVAASLLARPDRADRDGARPLTWSRD